MKHSYTLHPMPIDSILMVASCEAACSWWLGPETLEEANRVANEHEKGPCT